MQRQASLARGLYAALVFAALPLAGLILTNKADPDLWMHLRTGRLIAETRAVPRRDHFSFGAEGREWIDHEWLFQLLAYEVFVLGGSAGLLAVKGLVGAATMACVAGAAAERSDALSVRAAVFLASSLVVVCVGFTCRPQIATLLGCALIVFLHQRARCGGARALLDYSPWILLPWSWFHGGFVAGAAVYALIALGEALNGRPCGRLLTNLLLALAATAANPYGFGLWRKILEMLRDPVMKRLTLEWRPLWAAGVPLYRRTIVLFGAALGAAFVSDDERREHAAEWLLAAGGLAASVASVRHLLVLAILAVPALAIGLEKARRRGAPSPAPGAWFLRVFSAAVLGLLAGVAAWTFYEVPVKEGVPIGTLTYGETEPGWVTYPKGAARFFVERGISGRVWSEMTVGGYLIWHLGPACPVFVDGRIDLYSPDALADYAAVMAVAPGWERILAKRAPDLLLLPSGAPLAAAAASSGTWKPIYRDPDYVVLASGAPAYASLVREFSRAPRPSPRPPLPWFFP